MNGKYEYYFNVPHVVRDVYKNAGFEIPIDSDSIKDDWKGSKGKKIAEFIELNRKNVNLEFKQATDIRVMDKLELMSKLMQWVDSSISVTYMLPEKSTSKDVFNFIMAAYEKGVKSSNLDLDNKIVSVIYNPEKTTPEKLRTAISKLGYDADDIPLVKEAYDKLPACCKKPAPGQKVTH